MFPFLNKQLTASWSWWCNTFYLTFIALWHSFICTGKLTSWWRLLMSWRQICARPSADTMLTGLWLWCHMDHIMQHIDGLVQERRNSIANALDLCLSCTDPLICMITHWGWVKHICVGNLTIIGPDNGLSPGQRQAIIWTNAGILLIGTPRNKLQWNFNRYSNIFIQENAFENIVCEMVSILSRPQCDNTKQLWNQLWAGSEVVNLLVPLLVAGSSFLQI